MSIEYTEDGKVRLKRTSPYYMQVQGEMAIKNYTWAHFVVWTAADVNNLYIEEICFDQDLWENRMLPKLQSVYSTVLVPEILTRNIQQTL